jgi:hypothetical protein
MRYWYGIKRVSLPSTTQPSMTALSAMLPCVQNKVAAGLGDGTSGVTLC